MKTRYTIQAVGCDGCEVEEEGAVGEKRSELGGRLRAAGWLIARDADLCAACWQAVKTPTAKSSLA